MSEMGALVVNSTVASVSATPVPYGFSTISCLPDHILEDTWLHLMDIHLSDPASYMWENGWDRPSQLYPWLVVTRICRHWRAVALSCTRLWANIIATDPEEVSKRITSSGRAPLTIRTARYTDFTKYHVSLKKMNATFKLIAKEASRIVRLELRPTAQVYKALAACFYRDREFELSSLQDLSLFMELDDTRDVLHGLSYRPLPQLRRLDIQGGRTWLIETLRVEPLTSLSISGISLDLFAFLRVLARTPHLKRLVMCHDFRMGSLPSWHDKFRDAPQVSLPELELLEVNSQYSGPLLRALLYPQSVCIVVRIPIYKGTRMDFDDITWAAHTQITRLQLSFLTCRVVTIVDPPSIDIELWTHDLSLEDIMGSLDGSPKQAFTSPSPNMRISLGPVEDSIFSDPTQASNWRNVEYANAALIQFAHKASTWIVETSVRSDGLYDHARSLRRVCCTSSDSAIHLLDMLMGACLLDDLPFARHDAVLPGLQELFMLNIDWSTPIHGAGHCSASQDACTLSRYLVDTLQMRKCRGYKLKRLIIRQPVPLDKHEIDMLRTVEDDGEVEIDTG